MYLEGGVPAPLSPMSPKHSPRRTVRLRSSTAVNLPENKLLLAAGRWAGAGLVVDRGQGTGPGGSGEQVVDRGQCRANLEMRFL